MLSPKTKIALKSRICIILIQFLSNLLIPDHDANVFESPVDVDKIKSADWLVEYVFGGFRRWDAHYFLHISEHGYTYEHTMAFYPLYPFVIRSITNWILCLECISSILSFRSVALLVAITLNTFFFIKAAHMLQNLTNYVFNNNQRQSNRAVYLFCFNPASIFFTAPYTESLFAWLTFSVMYNVATNKLNSAILPLCLSIACRSNGFINVGFVLYYGFTHALTINRTSIYKYLFKLLHYFVLILLAILAFFSIQIYQYSLFCSHYDNKFSYILIEHAFKNGYVLAGERISSWCTHTVPLAYSYIQSYYWNVGFMKYYEIHQIPNFLLALPILIVFLSNIYKFVRKHRLSLIKSLFVDSNKQFVHMVHVTFLTLFSIAFVHIQVTTRLLASASPCLYWFCTFSMPTSQNPSMKSYFSNLSLTSKLIVTWFLSYYIIGTILFCNFLPWT